MYVYVGEYIHWSINFPPYILEDANVIRGKPEYGFFRFLYWLITHEDHIPGWAWVASPVSETWFWMNLSSCQTLRVWSRLLPCLVNEQKLGAKLLHKQCSYLGYLSIVFLVKINSRGITFCCFCWIREMLLYISLKALSFDHMKNVPI